MTVGVIDSTVIVHLFRKAPSALAWYDSLQRYSRTNDIQVLIETVRVLYQHLGAGASQEPPIEKPVRKIRRDDLKLICYEYLYT